MSLFLHVLFNLLFYLVPAAIEALICFSLRRPSWKGWIFPGVLAAIGLAGACIRLLGDSTWARGDSAGQSAVNVAARLFLCLLPCILSLLAMGVVWLRPAAVKLLPLLLLIGLIPINDTYHTEKSSGTSHETALYSITIYHTYDEDRPGGYWTRTDVCLRPIFMR